MRITSPAFLKLPHFWQNRPEVGHPGVTVYLLLLLQFERAIDGLVGCAAVRGSEYHHLRWAHDIEAVAGIGLVGQAVEGDSSAAESIRSSEGGAGDFG